MSKHTDKANRMYYTYRIDDRLYLIRKRKNGTYYTTFISYWGLGKCL